MRLLLAEAPALLGTDIETRLSEAGYNVTVCGSAEAALCAFEKDAFPLVLIPAETSQIDGLRLCRQIRALPNGNQSGIVTVTARSDPANLGAIVEAGADDFVAGPIEPEIVLATL